MLIVPRPPLQRAVAIVREKLIAAGHNVIEYIPYQMKEAQEIITRMWAADGGYEVQRDSDATGEPLPQTVERWLGHSSGVKPQTVFETWQNQHKRALLAKEWLERWQATEKMTGTGRPIDGLIMPSTPFPAIRHDGGYPWQYGVFQPLLDLTTGVFPVTKVDLEKDVVPAGWKALSEKDQQVMDYCEYLPCQSAYLSMPPHR